MASPHSGTVSPTSDFATASPARGAEMRNFLQSKLQKRVNNRTAPQQEQLPPQQQQQQEQQQPQPQVQLPFPIQVQQPQPGPDLPLQPMPTLLTTSPPLVHSWDFWHDRQDRGAQQHHQQSPTSPSATTPNAYEDRLVRLASVNDVQSFWSVFNNFDTTLLPLRDSIHLFKHGVKPIWEDPRNAAGGAWTFRVPKHLAPEFWMEICMMAIGEQLQAAVEQGQQAKSSFRDDICGVSLGVRFGSMLVQVWNRDGSHEEGVSRVAEVVLGSLGQGLVPREGSFYYKRHNEHAAFGAGTEEEGKEKAKGVGGGE